MKQRSKIAIRIACLSTVLVAVGLALAIRIGPPGPHFICHRGLVASFEQWKLETTNGDWYPNIDGNSIRSLEVIAPYMREDLRDYRYVPGLKSDDPEDLILVYLSRPSWRTWHGDTHWVRLDKRWVILNPRTSSPDDTYGRGWSEVGEAIPSAEFTNRLKATLEYLRQNHRQNWYAVQMEHLTFLASLKE
jgi:hypothetical protein